MAEQAQKKAKRASAEGRRRRGHGEGAIFQRGDGRWVASVDYGWVNGKRKRKDLYGKTRAEVREKLAREVQRRRDGLAPAPERLTVGQFLDDWLRDVVKPNKTPNTYAAYEVKVRKYLKPALGRHRLARLGPEHVQAFMTAAQEVDKVSATTVRDARTVLGIALGQAIRWGMVSRNAAELTTSPRVKVREVEPLDFDRARAFLEAIRGHRLEALFRVALALGIREGEALGLRWQDVDLDGRVVRIRKQLQVNPQTRILELVDVKSTRSRRSINLLDFAIRALRDHRARQLEDRLRAGEAWQDWQGAGLVFTDERGGAIPARNMLRMFDKLRTAAGLPGLRFHDTRHTCATFLLVQGVSERVVMEILGHSSLAMTQRYAHVLPPLRQDAADRLDAALRLAEEAPA